MRLLLSNRRGLGRRALAGALSVAMALGVNVLTQADNKAPTDSIARTAVTVTGSAIDFNSAIVNQSGNNAIVSGTTLRLGKANENGACGVEIANPFVGNKAMTSQSIVDALGGADATYNCYVWRHGDGSASDTYYVASYATVKEAMAADKAGKVKIVTQTAAMTPYNGNWEENKGITIMNLAQIVSNDAVSTTAVNFPLPEWETGATVSMWVKASSETKTPIFVFQDRKDNFVDPAKKANDQFGGAVLFTDGSFVFNQDDFSCGSNGTKRSTYAVETTSDAVPAKNLGKWVYVTISIQNDGVDVYYNGQKAAYASKMAQAATNTRYFNYGYGYKEEQGADRVKKYWSGSLFAERLSEFPYTDLDGTVKDIRTNIKSEGQVAKDIMQYLTNEDTALFLGGDDGKGSIFNNNAKVTFAYSNSSRDLQISNLAFYDIPSDQAKATELYNAQKDFNNTQNVEAPESDYFDYLSYSLTNSILASTGCAVTISGDSIRFGKGVSGAACGVQVTNPFAKNEAMTSQTIVDALGGEKESFNCYVWRRGENNETDAYYIAPYATVEEAKAAADAGKVKIVTDAAALQPLNTNWTSPSDVPAGMTIMNLSQLVKDEEVTLSRSAVDVFEWSDSVITSGSLKVLSPNAVVLPTTVSAEGISTLDNMLFKTDNLTLSASAANAITPDGNGGIKVIDGGDEVYTFENGYAQGDNNAGGNVNWKENGAVVNIVPKEDSVFVMSFIWNTKKLYVLEKDKDGKVTPLINGVANPNGSNAQALKFEVKKGNSYQVHVESKIMVSYMGYEDVEEIKVEKPIADAATDAALSFPLPEWETGATISTWVKASSNTKAPIFTFVDKGGNGSKMYGTEGTYGGATLYTDGSFQFYQDEANISAVGNGAKRNAYVVSTQNTNVPSQKVGEWVYVTISIQNDGVDVYFNGEKAEYSINSDFNINNGKTKGENFNYSYGYKGLQNKVAALVSNDFFGARLAYYMDGEPHAISDPIINKVADFLAAAKKPEGLDAEDLMHYLTSEETELYLGGDDGSARSSVNGFEQLSSGKWVGVAMAPYTEASEGMIISGFKAAENPVLTEELAKSLYELALERDTKDEPEEPEEPTVPTEAPNKTEDPNKTEAPNKTEDPNKTENPDKTEDPSGTTTNPPSGTTTNPPTGTTTNPPTGTTTNPPSGTTTNPPSGTTTNPPSGTTTNPPSGTTTNPPSGTQTTPPEPSKVLLGDVNLDGKVNMSDANAALLEALSIGTPLTGDAFKAADVNLDGKVTLEDANIILRVALGIESFEKAILVTKLGL